MRNTIHSLYSMECISNFRRMICFWKNLSHFYFKATLTYKVWNRCIDYNISLSFYLSNMKYEIKHKVGYTMADIRYQWNDGLNSVQISNDVSLPQFKVLGHRQKTIEASLSTGNYSRLACEIQFVRSMGYYLIQIYIPSRYFCIRIF